MTDLCNLTRAHTIMYQVHLQNVLLERANQAYDAAIAKAGGRPHPDTPVGEVPDYLVVARVNLEIARARVRDAMQNLRDYLQDAALIL